MKAITLAAAMAAVSCGAAIGVAVAGEPAPSAPLPPAAAPMAPLSPVGECMRAGNAREWGVVDAKRLVVRTWDNRHYDLSLDDACPAATKKAYLALLESRGGLRDGRICGDLGDAVLPVSAHYDRLHDHPCRIASMRRIDQDTYEQVFEVQADERRGYLDAAPDYAPAAGKVASR